MRLLQAAVRVLPVVRVERRRRRCAPPGTLRIRAFHPGPATVVVRPGTIGMRLTDPALKTVTDSVAHDCADVCTLIASALLAKMGRIYGCLCLRGRF